jgi:hypothetical protein
VNAGIAQTSTNCTLFSYYFDSYVFDHFPAHSQAHGTMLSALKLALEDSLKGAQLHKEQLEMMGQCAASMVGMSDRLLDEVTKAGSGSGSGSALEQHKVSKCDRRVKVN